MSKLETLGVQPRNQQESKNIKYGPDKQYGSQVLPNDKETLVTTGVKKENELESKNKYSPDKQYGTQVLPNDKETLVTTGAKKETQLTSKNKFNSDKQYGR